LFPEDENHEKNKQLTQLKSQKKLKTKRRKREGTKQHHPSTKQLTKKKAEKSFGFDG
jgi:hypothetical protein